MANGYGRSNEGFGITRQQSVALIVRTAIDNGVTDPRHIAYMLATAQHETRNFTAPDEDFGRQQARKLGYRGGEEYFGRGYVHLTHIENYQKFDRLLGLNGQLVKNPALAKEPEIAAKILVIGMRDGLFTGKPLSRYIDHDSNDTYNARRVVNGVNPEQPWSVKAAHQCATYSEQWAKFLTPERMAALRAESSGLGSLVIHAKTKDLQSSLKGLGYLGKDAKELVLDGVMGKNTYYAIRAFQRDHGLKVDGLVGPQTLKALEEAKAQQRALEQSKSKPEVNKSVEKEKAETQEQKNPAAASQVKANSSLRSDRRQLQFGEKILQRLDEITKVLKEQKPEINIQDSLKLSTYWLSRAVKEQFSLQGSCDCSFETRGNRSLMHVSNSQGQTSTADISKGLASDIDQNLALVMRQQEQNLQQNTGQQTNYTPLMIP